ncbi:MULTISPECIES: lipoyl domain-containing protein [Nguyenibacter]|uniref:Lipoyl domain-containing protein n=1 Tax=Nguyenibacter vanlangensis TaxID=1216886 RepID=A0ABZ3D824_9PROT|nr:MULTISPECIES: lipoyl domain-containing protein [Nguyenibacter]WRH88711.1 lipoyl domain-containing protein [Nguyenibacter sp. L1]
MTVPAAVAGVEEIRVLEWHGDTGSAFAPGDLIVELETHKAVVEVRAGQAGILREITAEPGAWMQIGVRLALFSDGADEAVPDGAIASDIPVEFEIT